MSHIIFISLICLSLLGCNPYRNQFNCQPDSGMGCEPLSTVNQAVNRHQLPRGKDKQQKAIKLSFYQRKKLPSYSEHPSQPISAPIRIWMPAYKNKNNAWVSEKEMTL